MGEGGEILAEEVVEVTPVQLAHIITNCQGKIADSESSLARAGGVEEGGLGEHENEHEHEHYLYVDPILICKFIVMLDLYSQSDVTEGKGQENRTRNRSG